MIRVSELEAFCYDEYMNFNATLCSTNGDEPWVANVNMTLSENEIITELKISYAHYKNIVTNSNVMVAYKNPTSELLVKATAIISEQEDDIATVIIQPTWMRQVEMGSTKDTKDIVEIIDILTEKIA